MKNGILPVDSSVNSGLRNRKCCADDEGDRHHARRQRADAQHRARRAHVERDKDGARADRDQRVDRLFGKRRRAVVDDAAMHGVAHQHGEREQRKQRRRGLHDEPRPAVCRARKLPGGETESQRRNAVAGQQRVEHRRPAKQQCADDGRIEGHAAQHDDDGADARASRAPDSCASASPAPAQPRQHQQHGRPQRAERHVQHQHRRDAGAGQREARRPARPSSGGRSRRAMASPPATNTAASTSASGGIGESRGRDCRR